jgi:DNA-binding NarL/FixJ family response regulator
MARPVRVVLADDHRLLLEAVRATLEDDGDFEVVAAVESAAEVLQVLARDLPDLVVLDVGMPGTDGFGCLQTIRDRYPDLKVAMLSGIEEPRVARRALRLGASAFVKKHVDPRDLAAVFRHAVEETVVSQPPGFHDGDDELEAIRTLLTASELAVLEALARGLVNKQIAADLKIAPQTVKFHLTNVYRKLGVANRTEAIRYAFEQGIVEPCLAAV